MDDLWPHDVESRKHPTTPRGFLIGDSLGCDLVTEVTVLPLDHFTVQSQLVDV